VRKLAYSCKVHRHKPSEHQISDESPNDTSENINISSVKKKLEYISEEGSLSESVRKESEDGFRTEESENTKWLRYGKEKVKSGYIVDITGDRVFVVDSDPQPEVTGNNDAKSVIQGDSALARKCKALSKKIRPLNDKFDTDYTVIDMIGNGNFGQVFKCKNNRNGKI
jgi:hypothetical protein